MGGCTYLSKFSKSVADNMNICELLVSNIDNCEKINIDSIYIIVTGNKNKPYFEIMYREVGQNQYNIGFSSYNLDFVFDYKQRYFNLVQKDNSIERGNYINEPVR